MSRKHKDGDEVPVEIVHANNRSRFSIIGGVICAIVVVVFEIVGADLWSITVVSVTAIGQFGRALWHQGYSTGYRGGLSSTYRVEPLGQATDTRWDVS